MVRTCSPTCTNWHILPKLQPSKFLKEALNQKLIQGEDYYLNEAGLLVFTAKYHLKRGYCCENGCRHCPYGYKKKQRDSGQGSIR